MPSVSRKIAACVSDIEECLNDETVWNQAGWEATIADIDIKIERYQRAIRELRAARKVAEQNLAKFKRFDWAKAEHEADQDLEREIARRKVNAAV